MSDSHSEHPENHPEYRMDPELDTTERPTPRNAADGPAPTGVETGARPERAATPSPDGSGQGAEQGADATTVREAPSEEPTRPAERPQPPTRLLGDRYEIGEVLGRGGMAEVHRATDARLGREVAVKELRTDLAGDPTFQQRFRREAQSAGSLNHPNIVAVYDTGEEYDTHTGQAIPYIVMELVEGRTLRDVLRDGRKILPERALEITQGVLDALGYSHRAGIVHRDIKPANVMLTAQGTVKVMDFGIARAVADTSATMTQTAAVIGTAQYLSPEQARGEAVDNRSDLYSAGCLMYELLVGRPPFVGDSPVSVAYQHVRELPVPPSQLDPVITPAMDAIVLKALTKDADERYQSAREMHDDISRLLGGQQVTAALPAPAPEPTSAMPAPVPDPEDDLEESEEESEDEEEQKKKRGPVVLVVLAVLLVGLLAAGLWWFNRDKPPAEPAPVSVPFVQDMDRASAENSIRNENLVPVVKEVAGADDATINHVIGQNPAGQQLVPPQSEVTIEVNVGPKKLAVPGGLVGQMSEQAKQQLEAAGFTKVTVTEAGSEPANATQNQVLGVTPAEGQSVVPDTEIVLSVATGKSEVPDWQGWNRDSVTSDAEAKGFTNVSFTERETTNASEVGDVIAQDPAPGTRRDRDSKITVVIGKAAPAPPPQPIPAPTTQAPAPQPTPTSQPSGFQSQTPTPSPTP